MSRRTGAAAINHIKQDPRTHKDPQNHNIPSASTGISLEAWLFKPSGPGPFPLVVAAHGMTVIKDAGLAAFGKRWAADAGFASVIFDFRYFGGSGGEPRNIVSLVAQREDYDAVIRWARLQPDMFLNNKIVVMGSALSTLAAFQLALDDPGLAGAMAHAPMLDVEYLCYETVISLGFNPRLLFWAAIDIIKGKLGLSPVFIRAVGRPSELPF
ncbi:Alpha/Beta hydrolase protein [Mycena rebaudengoi]|nr:Alpha/Beta hydrolase protein [Mycena rebaudengoi]